MSTKTTMTASTTTRLSCLISTLILLSVASCVKRSGLKGDVNSSFLEQIQVHAANRMLSDLGKRFLQQTVNFDVSGTLFEGGDAPCDFGMSGNGSFMYLHCTICEGSRCLTEVCSSDKEFKYLGCSICIVDKNESAHYKEFCMETTCILDTYLGDYGTMENSCTCQGAAIDGKQCTQCSFCRNDEISFDIEDNLLSSGDTGEKLMGGMALNCPREDIVSKTCDIPNAPATVKTQSKPGQAASSGIASALLIVPIVALIVGFVFFVNFRQSREVQNPKFNCDEEYNQNLPIDGIQT